MDGMLTQAPPHNLELEQALLGAILVNSKEVLPQVRQLVSGDDFFEPVHGDIFDACCALDEEGKEANPVTLKHHFANHPGLADVEGAAYLVRTAGSATTTLNAHHYAEGVRDLSRRRQLREHLQEQICLTDVMSVPTGTIVEDFASYLHEMQGFSVGENIRPTRVVVDDALERYNEARGRNGTIGLPTGFTDLDKVFTLNPSELTILAGRPAMGKSALANAISFAASHGYGDKQVAGLFFSKEMDAEDNIFRAISAEISRKFGKTVPYFRIRRGKLTPFEDDMMKQVLDTVKTAKITWIDEAKLTPSKIRSIAIRARREYERNGLELGFITIDYLQQVKPDNRSLRGLYEQTTAVSGSLLELAKELKIPVLALSQLSRNVEQRDDKTPMLADLRDSGSLEQDAANIIFAYRPEYYLQKEDKTADNATELNRWANKTQLIVAKNRMGPTATVTLNSNMAANHFQDV